VSKQWFWPALCCVAVLICILLANPFNEAGFEDDWSYAHVAMKLAQTGTIQYNGWGSPMLLFQSFWAIPWIWAFGFSVPVLQASMIPLSLGFVLLVYATGRHLRLSPELAAFGALAAGASPLFLPSAASFMTESCGCFFAILCVYAALRAIHSEKSGTAARWLWILALAGVIGGANRQIIWAAPVMLIPYVGWIRRSDSGLRAQAIAAYGISAVMILALVHFFAQPYGPMQLSRQQIEWLLFHQSGETAALIARLLLVCVLAAMPAYCCFLPVVRRRPLAWPLLSLIPLAAFTIGPMILASIGAPYGNNYLTGLGIISEGQEWIRAKPDILAFWVRVALTAVVNVCVFGSLAWISRRRWKSQPPECRSTLCAFGVFSLGYIALILPGALIGLAFDRYMLPLVALLILSLLMQFGRYERRIPVSAWCCLLVFSYYGIGTTHDYFAGLRARIAMAHEIEETGIGRDHISAGFEYDGWTLVKRSGYVRVVQYDDRFVDNSSRGFWFEFWNHAPDFRPDVVILNWNSTHPVHGGELRADFRAWTPPFRRSIVAWKRTDLTTMWQAATLAARMRSL
jgi:hypothetical protein